MTLLLALAVAIAPQSAGDPQALREAILCHSLSSAILENLAPRIGADPENADLAMFVRQVDLVRTTSLDRVGRLEGGSAAAEADSRLQQRQAAEADMEALRARSDSDATEQAMNRCWSAFGGQ